MAISLVKNESVGINLNKDNNTGKYSVGLGWDVPDGKKADLDVSVFMLSNDGNAKDASRLVFYNNLKSPDGAVEHKGDNRTGAGEGDDETIDVDLSKMPSDVSQVDFVVTIYAKDADHIANFGSVDRAFIRLINADTNNEEMRFDLTENFSTEDSVVIASLIKEGSSWNLTAVAAPFSGGLETALTKYGLA